MSYKEFLSFMKENIREFFPEEYQNATFSVDPVTKNNGLILYGLNIRRPGINVSPNLYLESFYKEYEEGRPLEDIQQDIADSYVELCNCPVVSFDIGVISDLGKVKERITCRLISFYGNEEYLRDKPYTRITDLAVTYHLIIGRREGGIASAPITIQLMNQYGLTASELHKIAVSNLEKNNGGVYFKTIQETMAERMLLQMMEYGMQEAREKIQLMMPSMDEDEQIYVLTNKDMMHGAAMVLDRNVMEEVSRKVGTDFYILPCSIHECLVLPESPKVDLPSLKNLVGEVNSTEVKPEEVLSYSVYKYVAGELSLVA